MGEMQHILPKQPYIQTLHMNNYEYLIEKDIISHQAQKQGQEV